MVWLVVREGHITYRVDGMRQFPNAMRKNSDCNIGKCIRSYRLQAVQEINSVDGREKNFSKN